MKVKYLYFISTLLFFSIHLCSASNTCTPGFYLSPSSGTCTPCPVGTYQPNYGTNGCIPCSPGFISTNTASTTCSSCKTGLTSNLYHTACVCPAGYELDRDSNSCKICPPGSASIASEDSSYCSYCPPNSYQPSAGATSCLDCPEGSSSGPEATDCLTCPEGQSPINGACGKCSPGYFYRPDYAVCIKCYPGTFQDNAGLDTNCKVCPESSYAGYGYRSCKFCKRRTALMKDGSCASCKGGEYYNEGSFTCQKCPAGQYTPCNRVFKKCFPCGPDSHSFEGSSKCIRCKDRTTLLSSGKCGICPVGTFVDFDNGRVCTRCAANTFNSKGTGLYCLSCPPNLYAAPGSGKCRSCPKGQAVIATSGKCEICPPGKSYEKSTGLCTTCYEGTFKRNAGIESCRSCPEGYVSSKDFSSCVMSH